MIKANNIDFSKYVVTFESYEEFFFEYVAVFGLLCWLRDPDLELDTDYHYHTFHSSPMYRGWLEDHTYGYAASTYHEKYGCFPLTSDTYRPIYISRVECEQIVSILAADYYWAYCCEDQNYTFSNSFGVKFLKGRYFTYCHDDMTNAFPTGAEPSVVTNPNSKKWDKIKLLKTYAAWFFWIRHVYLSHKDKRVFFRLSHYIALNKLELIDCAFSLSSVIWRSREPDLIIYFTPEVCLLIIDDIKSILEKYTDPSEEESKCEVFEFMIDVFEKLSEGQLLDNLDLRGRIIKKFLENNYILLCLFQAARICYPGNSVFWTKLWVTNLDLNYNYVNHFSLPIVSSSFVLINTYITELIITLVV